METKTKEKATSKFQQLLVASSKTIKANRAALIAEEAENAQNTILREREDHLRKLRRNLLELTDMHPDSELSLIVVKKDVNMKETFEKIQDIKEQLAIAEEQVRIAQETYDEWFK